MAKDRRHHKRARENETLEAREECLVKERQSRDDLKANETPEVRKNRLSKQNTNRKRYLENLTPDAREELLSKAQLDDIVWHGCRRVFNALKCRWNHHIDSRSKLSMNRRARGTTKF